MKKDKNKLWKQAGTLALSLALAVTSLPLGMAEVKASTSTMTADGLQYSNPVINSDVPDVDAIRVGDTYYMTSTTMSYTPGVPVMKSKDLVNWEICNYVYETMSNDNKMNLSNSDGDLKNNNGNAYSKGSWASSLRYFKGTYYCSFASYTTNKTYIYRTDDIENGAWEKAEFDGVYHDMSLYFDEETDKGYMIYGGTPIKIIELNEDYTNVVKGTDKVLIQKLWPELTNNPLGEGSHLMKIDGKFYLFLITWPSDLTTEDGEKVKGCRTQLCYTSDNLMGPYERHIVLNDQGAAQGQIVDTPEGEWYGFVFKDSGALGRTPVLTPVTWTTEGAKNGIKYPILGDNKMMPLTGDMPKTGEPRTTIVDSDEFYNQSEDGAMAMEVLQNGNFESGLTGWTNREGTTLTLVNSPVAGGKQALKVSDRRNTGSGVTQDITGKVKAGKEYTISGKIQYRYDEADAPSSAYPDTKQFFMSIVYGDGTIKNIASANVTKGQWGDLSGTYTIPADADLSKVTVFLETPWTGSPDASKDLMTFYADDLSITGEGSRFTSPDGSKLKLEWQWNHNPDNANWSLTENPGYLRIRNARTDRSILHTRNTLTQRVFGPTSNAYVKMNISNMKDGDVAGLAGIQEKYGYIGVKKEEGKYYLVQSNTDSKNKNGIDSWKEENENARMEINQDEVLLRMAFDCTTSWQQTISFYYSLDDGKNWTKLGKTSQVGFELTHFVGTRFGLFNYATIEAGGYTDFDYFRVEPGKVQEGAVTVKDAWTEQENLEIFGDEGTEVEIPVMMDTTDTDCTAIEATFSVPENMKVVGVDFDKENVTGTCAYEATANSLELRVEGQNVRHRGGRFAVIKLAVSEAVKGEKHVQLAADCIRGIGKNIEYDVSGTKTNIALIGKSDILTSGTTKTPGRTNPLMDHKFGADPYAITYDGRVYVYMTNDSQQYNLAEKDSNGYPTGDNNYGNIATINVISSDDMVNWVDHGAIPVAGKNAQKDPNGIAKWANNSWAPAACHKVIDGKDKFFLYFADNANGIGVLEADSPIGPFREPATGSQLIKRGMQAADGVTWLFDPAVLVDDDGTGYLYYGGGIPGGNNPTQDQKDYPKTGRVVKLKDNMVEVDGDAAMIDAPGLFEDSGIHKYNNKYYYTYCSNFSTNLPETGRGNICAMESDSPMGPFTFVGKVFDNPANFFGIGGNNHHAFFEFGGQSYFIYHAQTVGKALNLPKGGYRSTHIDAFEYDQNGHIKTIKGTWNGIAQKKNLDAYARVEAETLGWSKGITTGDCSELGGFVESLNLKLTQINNGDWTAISKADLQSGAKTFKVKAAGLAGGTLEIHLDKADGALVGEVVIPAGDGNTWEEYSCNVEGAQGIHDLYFVFKGAGSGISQLFELDYWQFLKDGDEPGGDTDLEEAIKKAQEAQAAAEKAKAEAEAAKEQAQSAKAEAETAKEQAQTAKAEADAAKAAAEKAKADALTAQKAAEQAKAEAEAAKNQAGADSAAAKEAEQKAREEAAKAEAAKKLAEDSSKAALQAKADAEKAMSAAEEKAAKAQEMMEKAETAQKKAEAVLAEALNAQKKAEEERIAAEAAQKKAEADRLAAEAAQKKAEADRLAAEAAAAEAAGNLEAAQKALKEAQAAQAAAEKANLEAQKAKEEFLNALNKNSQKVTVKKVNLKSVKRSRKGSIKVSWAKVSDASGYELQYSTSSKFKGAKTKKISKAKTTYTLKKLKSGKIYRVRIRAYKIAEGKKVYGSYSKVRKVRVK